MVDADRSLSEHVAGAAPRELSALVESGFVTPETQRTLAIATQNMLSLKQAATPVGQRQFNRIDTYLSVRSATPTSQARECLSDLAPVWEELRGNFHKYRAMFLEVKVRQAKLNKRRKEIEAITDPDDRTIADAECEFEQAQIERIQADLARGQSDMQGAISKATSLSASYAALLTSSGKVSFTEEDFLNDEIEYLLKSAFWVAATGFSTYDRRDKWDPKLRASQRPARSAAEENQNEFEAKKFRMIRARSEVLLYLESLGIPQADVKVELDALLRLREAHNRVHRSGGDGEGSGYTPPFDDQFNVWLGQMTARYKAQASAAVAKHGIERLRRISAIIDPNTADAGKQQSTTERDSVL